MDKPIMVVAGAGFGDEGKGAVVDYLTRMFGSETVVRYNGGPQAAHHVILSDRRWHCFSQFGSGTFVPGTKTCLSEYMLANPAMLKDELGILENNGVPDALERISIHPDCVVVTPLHRLLNQMKELIRGDKRHGSVGMGVGEAVKDSDVFASQMLRMGDLTNSAMPGKINFLWAAKIDQAEQLLSEQPHSDAQELFDSFLKSVSPRSLVDGYGVLGEVFKGRIAHRAPDVHGGIVFEGAQGALLDRRGGFPPHVTKTDSTIGNANRLISELNIDETKVEIVNVVRAFAHRHGAGPFVTEEPLLSPYLDDDCNRHNQWQGAFRVGWFDVLATRYALSLNGYRGMLAVTNLDRLAGLPEVRACVSYALEGTYRSEELDRYFEWSRMRNGTIRITSLRHDPERSESERARLTELLFRCQPLEYRDFHGWGEEIKTARNLVLLPATALEYLAFIQSKEGVDRPIGLVSVGPLETQKFTW